MQESRGNSREGGGGGGRRRRGRGGRGRSGGGGGGGNREQGNRPQGGQQPRAASAENRNRSHQSGSRNRNRHGRPLTSNQVLVKYDNLLDQHLIARRKYFEYFNRVDDRQLRRLEKNFYDSVEHLRRFEGNLEPWQREALEKRKTERYAIDATYSLNRGLDPHASPEVEVTPEEIEDPHFKDSQKEAFEEYKEDTEESSGSYEDYLRYKGQA